jgi:hypothetical protein
MTRTVESTEGFEALRARFNGEIVLPGEPGYEAHREHFNKVYDKHPAIIARPVGTADVVAAVGYARSAGLEIAVSSGGKHGSGFSRTDGGIVIDLSLMRGVQVDPDARTAWLQGGANGGDLQAEAQVHGLAGVIGWMRGTGVGGVNLHGGFGMLTSKLGFGVDTILELELVTADGQVLRVTNDSDPELFWGLRGAAGNFGIVTWVKQRLTPVPAEIAAGQLLYTAEQAPAVLGGLDAYAAQASEDLTMFGSYTVVPHDPNYPEDMHGQPAFVLTVVHIGDADQAAADLKPLRETYPPALDLVQPVGLYDFICSMDAYIIAGRQWYDMVELGRLDEAAIAALARGADALAATGLEGELIVVPHGRGRLETVPSAVPTGRPGTTSIVAAVYWQEPENDEQAENWSTQVLSALRETGSVLDAVYGNMANPVDPERDRRSHGEADWNRLRALKAKYDPENLFHLNHNIPPAG